jgi:peptidoglycan/xylan/chitin deacetylase (PgdA/CDA1 family)
VLAAPSMNPAPSPGGVSTSAVVRSLPVLTFHALDDLPSPVAFAPRAFDKAARRLAAEGAVSLSLDDVLRFAKGEGPPPRPGAYLPTFDDGYASVVGACDVLLDLGVKPLLFLCPTLLDRDVIFPGDALCPKQRALTWGEAATLAKRGAAIGSHAFDHVDLRKLSDAALHDALVRSRGELEERLGVPVRSLAYPFGFNDARVVRAAAATYDAAFTTRLGRVQPGDDLHRLPRLDAHYLRFLETRGSLDGAGVRAYLALRGFGRAVKDAFGGGAT